MTGLSVCAGFLNASEVEALRTVIGAHRAWAQYSYGETGRHGQLASVVQVDSNTFRFLLFATERIAAHSPQPMAHTLRSIPASRIFSESILGPRSTGRRDLWAARPCGGSVRRALSCSA